MYEGSADKTFVRGEKLELAVHEGEELFFQGRLSQTGVFSDRSNSLVHLLLEEMQGDVFFGPEIIKDGAFGNTSLARNGFSCRSVKALSLKERQSGGHYSLPNRCFVLRAPPRRPLRCGRATARFSLRCRFLVCRHSMNS